jgi:hypothetical protein
MEEKEGLEGDLVFSMDDDNSRRNSSLWGSKSPVISPLGETKNGVGVGVGGGLVGVQQRKGGGGGGAGTGGGGSSNSRTFANAGLENVYSGGRA